ncbi:MAG: nitrophenyl compound nitroreductase subunit ArsF family protein [Planctomycetota bacterium]
MNPKTAVRWFLLAVVLGSVAFYLWRRPDAAAASSGGAVAAPDVAAASVVVTYFTTNVRCDSCRTIERLSRKAVEEGFPADVASGRVVYRVLNTDLPENQHFLDDYEIANKTVIVSHQVAGKETEWTNRQDVWLMLDQPDEFLAYVREPVGRFLGKD